MSALTIPPGAVIHTRALGSTAWITVLPAGATEPILRRGCLSGRIIIDAGGSLDRRGRTLADTLLAQGDPVEFVFEGGLKDAIRFRADLRRDAEDAP